MAPPEPPETPSSTPKQRRGLRQEGWGSLLYLRTLKHPLHAVRNHREYERERFPGPVIPHRIPSGRKATEQPNISGDGEAELTPMFWLVVVATGIAAGLFGDAMMVILFGFQHLAFAYHTGSFEAAVEHVSPLRRIVSLSIAGAFGGVAWYFLRKYTKGKSSEVDESIWSGTGVLSFGRSLGTSVISEVVIGMGASIGREAAPKLMGSASGSVLSTWAKLTPGQRRLIVACGGGAGLAAVYNVPLGGALFTAEILYGSIKLPVILPALLTSGIATAVAWLYLPIHATYLDIPAYHFRVTEIVWAIVVGPIIGIGSVGFVRSVAWVSHHRITGKWALVAPLIAFAIVGAIGAKYPQLFGNGKDMAHDAFVNKYGLLLLIALFTLKPLVTSLCLGSGASGGLFTPTLSTGAMLGGAFGIIWSWIWPGAPVGAYAMMGAAAMIGAGAQAPLSALALVLELTHSGFNLMVPMLITTTLATAVARQVDGYSIYSARLAGLLENPGLGIESGEE